MLRPPAEGRRSGVLGALSARVKLVGTFGIVAITLVLPRRPDLLYCVPLVALLVLWPLSLMPFAYAVRRLLLVEIFIVGIFALSLLSPSAGPVVLSAFFKSNLCLFTMLLLTWTTPFQEILTELRRLRFPAVMLTTLALMYRYLPVVADESRRMQRARTSRTFSRHRLLEWQNLTNIIGQLFIRTADRAERLYLAMCARGWR